MSLEFYCELTPVKPCYIGNRDEPPYETGRFYAFNCHIAWGIGTRLKEDILEPGNERVYFYRYYKGVPPKERKTSSTESGTIWNFQQYPRASVIVLSEFKKLTAFYIDFELRSNTPIQFFAGHEAEMNYIREIPLGDRTMLERIGPFNLYPNEWLHTFARPTYRMPEGTAGKIHRDLKPEEKYLWMEFYRANVYVQHEA